jgi:DNA-binding MarR family transcriptional regulator
MSETNTAPAVSSPFDALHTLHRATVRVLKELPLDLSQRQLAILLTIYMAPPPHTVRSLSEQLGISKPAVCRALDMLSLHDLVRRKKDEADRRIVYLTRTVNGSVYLRDLGDIYAVEMASEAAISA